MSTLAVANETEFVGCYPRGVLLCARLTPLRQARQLLFIVALPPVALFLSSKIHREPAIFVAHLFRDHPMDMLMIVFRTSLRERVHELLRTCGVAAYTEFPGALGTGQSGSTEGISFYAGGNSVIMVSLESAQRDKVADVVKTWCAEAQHSGWVRPAIRVFCWPCAQLI
jgi:hypothetical protein